MAVGHVKATLPCGHHTLGIGRRCQYFMIVFDTLVSFRNISFAPEFCNLKWSTLVVKDKLSQSNVAEPNCVILSWGFPHFPLQWEARMLMSINSGESSGRSNLLKRSFLPATALTWLVKWASNKYQLRFVVFHSSLLLQRIFLTGWASSYNHWW